MRLPDLCCMLGLVLAAASEARGQPLAPSPSPSSPPGIQDNSFLLEESYNQERGVVQHISSFNRSWRGRDWVYTFTQEWPLPGIKHQISVSIPFQRLEGRSGGFGDVALNYRHQLAGDGEAHLACAPRLSVLLPTGDERKDYGAGNVGIQVNVPVSLVLTDDLVTHANVGATFTRSAKNGQGDTADLHAYNLGQSFIWLAHTRFNLLVEVLWTRSDSVVGPDRKAREDNLLINPGVRWSYNSRSGLQIVPGVAFPFGVGPSRGEKRLFLYLSFEHPFRRLSK